MTTQDRLPWPQAARVIIGLSLLLWAIIIGLGYVLW